MDKELKEKRNKFIDEVFMTVQMGILDAINHGTYTTMYNEQLKNLDGNVKAKLVTDIFKHFATNGQIMECYLNQMFLETIFNHYIQTEKIEFIYEQKIVGFKIK